MATSMEYFSPQRIVLKTNHKFLPVLVCDPVQAQVRC